MSVTFAPVDTGDMSEIPPDAPAGEWTAVCKVKLAATKKDNYPMLVLNWKLTESFSDGGDDHVGATVTDFLTFFPAKHAASKMGKLRMKAMCEALGIELPTFTSIQSEDDLAEFIAELEGIKAKIWTKLEERKDTGEMTTKVLYSAPGLRIVAKADDDDDKPAKKSAKVPAKKAAGRR